MNLVEITIKADANTAKAFAEVIGQSEAAKIAIRGIGTETNKTGGIFSNVGKIFTGSIMAGIKGLIQSGPLGVAAFASIGAAAGAAGFLIATAAAVILGPFMAALATITLGVAGFALMAKSAFSQVWTAVQGGDKAIDQLPKAMQPVANQLVGLKTQFHQLFLAVRPEILIAFAYGIKIIKDLMPALKPLLEAAGKAIDGLLKNIDAWLKSPSGKKFIEWFQKEAPMALRNFGIVAWAIIRGIGDTLHFLYDTGETFLRHWDIVWHDAFVVVDNATKGFTQLGHLIESMYNSLRHSVAQALDGIRQAWVDTGHSIESTWNSVYSFISSLVNRIISIITGVPGRVSGALSSVFRPLIGAAQSAYNVVSGIVNSIIGAISSINGALGGIPGKVLGALGLATGGVVGAASGMARGGLTLVGEHGPELVRLPVGSSVNSNPDTQRMLSGSGGTQKIELVLHGEGPLGNAIIQAIRPVIRTKFGGNVQLALGYY